MEYLRKFENKNFLLVGEPEDNSPKTPPNHLEEKVKFLAKIKNNKPLKFYDYGSK
jgi:hypothetical protein